MSDNHEHNHEHHDHKHNEADLEKLNIQEYSEENSEDNVITIVDDEGNEELYQILFTFDSEDFGKSYVLLYPQGTQEDEEVSILAFSFIPDENGDASKGDLTPIEADDEWDMVEEVLNTFLDSDDE